MPERIAVITSPLSGLASVAEGLLGKGFALIVRLTLETEDAIAFVSSVRRTHRGAFVLHIDARWTELDPPSPPPPPHRTGMELPALSIATFR